MADLGFQGPQAGNAAPSGLMQILGALGTGMQGYLQGRQFRDQEQLQQQQLSNEKLGGITSLFKMMQSISPDQINSSPEMQGLVGQAFGSAGLKVPHDPGGKIDASGFGTPLMGLTSDPQLYGQFNQYEPGSVARKEMLAHFAGSDTEKQELLNSPRVYTAAQIDNAATNYRYYMNLIQGGADPRSLVPIINKEAQVSGDPQVQITAQGVVPAGGSAALGPSSKTVSQIAGTDTLTQLRQQEVKALQAKYPFIAPMESARLQHYQAATTLASMQAAAIPKRLQIQATNASANMMRAEDNRTKLSLALADFNKLGMSPQAVGALNGVQGRLQQQLQLDQTAAKTAGDWVNNYLKIHSNPKPADAGYNLYKMQAGLAKDLQQRIHDERGMADNLRLNKPDFIKRVLQEQGAPNSWSTPHVKP